MRDIDKGCISIIWGEERLDPRETEHVIEVLNQYRSDQEKHPDFADFLLDRQGARTVHDSLKKAHAHLEHAREQHQVSSMDLVTTSLLGIAKALFASDLSSAKAMTYETIAVLLRLADSLGTLDTIGPSGGLGTEPKSEPKPEPKVKITIKKQEGKCLFRWMPK